ncbi:DUF4446 family protein [Selenomonas sp. F0473]|uniref:DUF4446 family protein n=1 Tax=Selenomonas sp. F0473 TaxID=999423 RepID=UPI00029E244F|nr:DUF4446 family protein [Selenomonas sp. F0473]EKU71102.1 hypothetical protein HMPREF9161_01196 [Selenomonas sp. F0473]
MFLQNLVKYIAANEAALLLASMILILVLLILVVYQMVRISGMRSRYRAMMRGTEAQDLEGMLIKHVKDVEDVAATNTRILEENELIRQFLRRTLVRTAAVRFRAFDDMGGDLSYAVALLDANNDGIIFSSIFAREDSRSYVKPVKGGTSEYALSDEEKSVLKEAMGQSLPIQW